jgi:hypothetical protein
VLAKGVSLPIHKRRGQCHNHEFGRSSPIFKEKNVVFLKKYALNFAEGSFVLKRPIDTPFFL